VYEGGIPNRSSFLDRQEPWQRTMDRPRSRIEGRVRLARLNDTKYPAGAEAACDDESWRGLSEAIQASPSDIPCVSKPMSSYRQLDRPAQVVHYHEPRLYAFLIVHESAKPYQLVANRRPDTGTVLFMFTFNRVIASRPAQCRAPWPL